MPLSAVLAALAVRTRKRDRSRPRIYALQEVRPVHSDQPTFVVRRAAHHGAGVRELPMPTNNPKIRALKKRI